MGCHREESQYARLRSCRCTDELPALTNDEVLALQLRQVLGDSGPRSPDEIGNVLVAERCFEKRAARLFDSEIGSQFKQRNGNACMRIEVQETGTAQQQPVALLQIVLMNVLKADRSVVQRYLRKCSSSDCRLCNHRKLRIGNRTGRMAARKLGDRTGRKQGDGHPLSAGVLASDARDAL